MQTEEVLGWVSTEAEYGLSAFSNNKFTFNVITTEVAGQGGQCYYPNINNNGGGDWTEILGCVRIQLEIVGVESMTQAQMEELATVLDTNLQSFQTLLLCLIFFNYFYIFLFFGLNES